MYGCPIIIYPQMIKPTDRDLFQTPLFGRLETFVMPICLIITET